MTSKQHPDTTTALNVSKKLLAQILANPNLPNESYLGLLSLMLLDLDMASIASMGFPLSGTRHYIRENSVLVHPKMRDIHHCLTSQGLIQKNKDPDRKWKGRFQLNPGLLEYAEGDNEANIALQNIVEIQSMASLRSRESALHETRAYMNAKDGESVDLTALVINPEAANQQNTRSLAVQLLCRWHQTKLQEAPDFNVFARICDQSLVNDPEGNPNSKSRIKGPVGSLELIEKFLGHIRANPYWGNQIRSEDISNILLYLDLHSIKRRGFPLSFHLPGPVGYYRNMQPPRDIYLTHPDSVKIYNSLTKQNLVTEDAKDQNKIYLNHELLQFAQGTEPIDITIEKIIRHHTFESILDTEKEARATRIFKNATEDCTISLSDLIIHPEAGELAVALLNKWYQVEKHINPDFDLFTLFKEEARKTLEKELEEIPSEESTELTMMDLIDEARVIVSLDSGIYELQVNVHCKGKWMNWGCAELTSTEIADAGTLYDALCRSSFAPPGLKPGNIDWEGPALEEAESLCS